MKDKVQVVVIKDPDGNIWATPKGKSSWSSVGAAKNAWGCHTWLDNGPNKYNPKLRSTRQGKWSQDAEGWSCEVVADYILTRVK
jgi:hypothetical protein